MSNIKTGKNIISLKTLLATWSVSAVTSLPGLAVSPILGHLDRIFPDASDSDLQMLTSLPSILIIPFILLSGHLGTRKNKLTLLAVGLTTFILSGIGYFFVQSINDLLFVSLILGVGVGLIIPLSTGLINDLFAGQYRVRQFGISSFITNLTLVLATALTGWLAQYNWHYPFIVYLIPALPLSLLYFLSDHYLHKKKNTFQNRDPGREQPAASKINEETLNSSLLFIMIIYFLATTVVLVIPYNLPFLLQQHHYRSDISGVFISVFFIAMMLPGLIIKKLTKWLSKQLIALCFAGITCGLAMLILIHHWLLLSASVAIAGFCYGIIQPFLYEKTAAASAKGQGTFSLSMMMSMNYTAVALAPWLYNMLPLLIEHVIAHSFAHWNSITISFWMASITALMVSTVSALLCKLRVFRL